MKARDDDSQSLLSADGVDKLVRDVLDMVRPKPARPRQKLDPAEIDRELANERAARVTRRCQPRHALETPRNAAGGQNQAERFDPFAAFSVAQAKRKRRVERAAKFGVYPRRPRRRKKGVSTTRPFTEK